MLNCLQLLPSGVYLKQLVVGKCCSERQETALLKPCGSSLFAVQLSGLFTSEGSFAQSIKVFTRDKVGDGGQYLRQDRGRLCANVKLFTHYTNGTVQLGSTLSLPLILVGQEDEYISFLGLTKLKTKLNGLSCKNKLLNFEKT